eukprot:SAG11_NODE_13238_length_663_cov_9.620567_1_plen_107_part_00
MGLLKSATDFDQGGLSENELPRPNDQTEYEVEQILATRRNGDRDETFYLVKWTGYSFEDSTWEPEAHLANCTEALKEFERRSTHARYPTHEDMMADQENGIIIDEI